MLEKLMVALKFAARQKTAMYDAVDMLKKLFTFKVPFKKVFAGFVAVFQLLGAAFCDRPVTPYKDPIDLSGYELVFEDEFEGDKLNMDVWQSRHEGKSRAGYDCIDQVSVKDGRLIINGCYRENGKYGAGWYAGDIRLKQEYLRGYFEIRCKVVPNSSNTHDFWSAFWLTNSHAYDPEISKGGVGAVELDIMECFTANAKKGKAPEAVSPAIWCNGVDGDPETTDGRILGRYKLNDPCNEYNTYGLMWTEDEYIFYINGVETVRSTYSAGVCQVPEIVVVSLTAPPNDIPKSHDYSVDYDVDYVRIYQLAK